MADQKDSKENEVSKQMSLYQTVARAIVPMSIGFGRGRPMVDLDGFDKEVSDIMALGYVPLGPPTTCVDASGGGMIVQALIRKV